jgi:hypothetical protein
MKRLSIASVCIVALSGLAHGADLTQAEAEKIAQQRVEQFTQAWQSKQPEKMVALFADDGWRITDAGPVIGKEALLKHWTAVFQVVNLVNTQADHVKVIDNDNVRQPATGKRRYDCRINHPNLALGFGSSPTPNKRMEAGGSRWRPIT